jgi:hypothetical protein
MTPRDHILIAAFDRGRTKGQLGTKYGRTQCPHGESRPYQRDAWLAGYDFGSREAV